MKTGELIEPDHASPGRSTGPRTAEGKARSRLNAVAHGLASAAPVLPGERAEAWEAHSQGIVASLAPSGALEAELAGRVALCLWRLRRVAAYETGITDSAVQDALDAPDQPPSPDPMTELLGTARDTAVKARKALEEKRQVLAIWKGSFALLRDLPGLADDAPVSGDDVYGALEDINGSLPKGDDSYFDTDDGKFLTSLGVPNSWLKRPWTWPGWTAGAVRRAVEQIAQKFDADPRKLLADALASRQRWDAETRAEVLHLEEEVRRLEHREGRKQDRAVCRALLPEEGALDRIIRYEAHLSRQMLQAMHTLERLQKTRAGESVPPPAAVDVTASSDAGPVPEFVR
jgi:hypothetical protein